MKYPRVIWNPGWSKLGQVAGAIWILMTTLLICARILLPYYGVNLDSKKKYIQNSKRRHFGKSTF